MLIELARWILDSFVAMQAFVLGTVVYSIYSIGTSFRDFTQKDHSYQVSSYKTRLFREPDNNVVACQPYFLNKDKLYIFWRVWDVPSGVQCKGILILCHGINEHSGRYHHVARAFNEIGLKVYAIDHQGHGMSEGDRLFVKDFDDYIVDVIALFKRAQQENTGKKMFILGHSLGGLIAILSTLKAKQQGLRIDGAVYSAPAVWLNPKTNPPFLLAILATLSSILPKMRMVPLNIDTLNRDKNVKDLYINDPLVNPTPATIWLQSQVVKYQAIANNGAPTIDLPVMLLHGTKDHVVEKQGTDLLFEKLTMKDKQYKVYENEFHEMFNCPDYKNGALKDVTAWFKMHL